LAFPGIFRGCVDIYARKVTTEMKIEAAYAIAGLVNEKYELSSDHIIPGALDLRVPQAVARAVANQGIKEKVNRNHISGEYVSENIRTYLVEGLLREAKL